MTLFNLHADQTGVDPSWRVRAMGYAITVLKAAHRAIVSAKLRRLRYELMFHKAADNVEARKLLQRPMLLGDKWDF